MHLVSKVRTSQHLEVAFYDGNDAAIFALYGNVRVNRDQSFFATKMDCASHQLFCKLSGLIGHVSPPPPPLPPFSIDKKTMHVPGAPKHLNI